jgi:predicted ABC-type ATPase
MAAIKAGKIMLDEIHAYAEAKKDFAFETTLSGRTYIHLLKDLRSKGYQNQSILSLVARSGFLP